MTDETNKRIGDYEILSVLGAGGMGKVYKVRNVISDRVEAMKVLLPDLSGRRELADRFLREIKLLAGLHHPNIAELRTALTWDNQLVMIMEYLEGVTLAERRKQGPISPRDAVDYADQVLAALSYAHGLQIIHRDIKPSNMMLTPQGVVKLMDFGIARSKNDPILTASGSTLGSLHYMSPEQVKGEAVDARSDLYSLGVSLYEMAAGRLPFEAENDFAIMAAHLQRPPAAPITVRPEIPQALSDIILIAMAKDPAERFQSADAFRNALKTIWANEPAAAVSTPAPQPDGVAEMTIASATPPGEIISAVKSAERISSFPAPLQTPPPAQPSPTPIPLQPVAQPQASSSTQPQASSPAQAQLSPSVAQVPNSPPPQPVAQVNPVAANASSTGTSHRGLYISLGAVIVLVVLFAAGLYVPRKNRAHAEHETTTTAQPPATTTQPSTSATQPSTSATQPSTSATQPSTPATNAPAKPEAETIGKNPTLTTHAGTPDTHGSTATEAPKSPEVSSTGTSRNPNPASSATPGTTTPGGPFQRSSNTTAFLGGKDVSSAKSKGPESSRSASSGKSKQEERASLNVPSVNNPPPAPDAGQLQELEHEFDLLTSRAEAVDSSLDGMRQTQAAQGLGMRGDIASSQQRMRTYMAKAQDALKRQDASGTKKYLGLAEPEVSGLEKFLGR